MHAPQHNCSHCSENIEETPFMETLDEDTPIELEIRDDRIINENESIIAKGKEQQLVQRSIFVPPRTKSRRTRVRDLRRANYAIASTGTFTHARGHIAGPDPLWPLTWPLFWGKSPHVAAARSRTPELCPMKDYNPVALPS
ncbi:hypothetical protein LXL04_003759 [Taraxacum kok-saghyz]